MGTIKAQRYVLVDKNGHERGSWRVENERVSLEFLDENGDDWVTIFAVMKENGLASLSIGSSDPAYRHVRINASRIMADVGVYDEKIPGSTKNRPKASLAIRKGAPVLELIDFPGKAQVTLSVANKKPKMEMRDEKDEISWATP